MGNGKCVTFEVFCTLPPCIVATTYIYIILLYPDERRRRLISGFFHVNQGVLCSEHAGQASCRGVLEGGGGGGGGGNRLAKLRKGSNRLPGLVTKQQAVEFPQVLTSYIWFAFFSFHFYRMWFGELKLDWSISSDTEPTTHLRTCLPEQQ